MIKRKTPADGKGWGQVQIGTSSLVLIFTVLCLVVFSTLSIASAKMDQKLAEKNQQYVKDYYIGDGKAEEILKEINSKLIDYENNQDGEENFQAFLKKEFGDSYQQGVQLLTYRVDLNKEQFLLVELELLTRGENRESNKKYMIRKWVVKNKVDYEIYDDLPVWDGTSIE